MLGGFCQRHQPAAARPPRRLWLISHHPLDLLCKLCVSYIRLCMYLRVHVYVRAGADTCCSLEFVVGVMFWSCLPNPVLGQSSGK